MTTASELAVDNDFTKKFSAKFISDDSLNSVLSVYNDSNSSESECSDVIDSKSEGINIIVCVFLRFELNNHHVRPPTRISYVS